MNLKTDHGQVRKNPFACQAFDEEIVLPSFLVYHLFPFTLEIIGETFLNVKSFALMKTETVAPRTCPLGFSR